MNKDDAGEFAALRDLIVGPEQEKLSDLQDRLDSRERRTRDVSEVLPEAAAMRADDAALSRALAPAVEDALIASVRANPNTLADVLFPVMGPAIRKSLTQFLAAMLEGMNRTLEQSFSLQGLAWRWEAWRTGKSFAEVVLLHTLLYRTEQVFLIHRQTGLPLVHVTAPEVREAVKDADMVSGMLTAIRDFVQDAFKSRDGAESVDAMRVGELEVWVEQGPHALIAGVVRGVAPKDLRTVFQETLERIHAQFGRALDSFSGDMAPFAAAQAELEQCLRSGYRTVGRRRLSPALAMILVVASAAGLWLAFSFWQDGRRWADYLARLRGEPGILVVSDQTRWRRHSVSGFRDPMARDPQEILRESGLDSHAVTSRWEPYQAAVPQFILSRAKDILQPPPNVNLSFDDGVLMARGVADTSWANQAAPLARLIPGVRMFEHDLSLDAVLQRLRPGIEGCRLFFPSEAVTPLATQRCVWMKLVDQIRELAAAAKGAGKLLRVSVVGYADSSGQIDSNVTLSQARAEGIRAALIGAGTSGVEVVAVGRGARNPELKQPLADDRYVTFRVSIAEPTASDPSSERR